MSTAPTCPDCGAPLGYGPRGLCTRCLLQLGVALNTAGLIAEGPGTIIGRYMLQEKIGEGGFGVVYLAEQFEPVQRKVALKIIKPGMDTREVVARFEVERQALALMDHPNIAKVLDGGATDTGRPYFVMELVQGIPITQYCDQKALSATERLGVFMQVCHAVQHAHQKGIIHRDLKPSNILVMQSDGKPVPKVIDFGVAKALGQKLTEKTLFTAFQRMIGTPAYMSPEQAELSPDPSGDIDTRSDIYSLGVLLYELLTGVTPFDAEALGRAALDEVRRMIRETEPLKPSTRLDALGERRPEVAKHRHTEPVALSRALRGDLDWIVMKCLEKDRTRRYGTADALTLDLEHHLFHQPVTAGAPTLMYRLAKFGLRHRAALVTAGAFALLLVTGTVVSVWQASRARQAAEQNHRRLMQLIPANGNRSLSNGDNFGALAWSVVALRQDSANPRTEPVHRLRLGTLLQQCPTIVQMWFTDRIHDYAQFAGGDSQVLVPIANGRWAVHDLVTGRMLYPPFGPGTDNTDVALGSASCLAAVGSNLDRSNAVVQVWNYVTGEEVATLRYSTIVDRVAISPDGHWVAATSLRGHLAQVWNLTMRNEVRQLAGYTNSIFSLAFSPDGQRLVTAGLDCTAIVWDLRAGVKLAQSTKHTSWIWSVAFSPDGRLVATAGGFDRSVRLWETETMREVLSPLPHGAGAHSVGFNADGTRLITADLDFLVRVWDARSGTLLQQLPHNAIAVYAAFSPSGRYIVTGCADGTQRVWSLRSPELPSKPTMAAFSPDGHFCATATNQTIQINKVSDGELLGWFPVEHLELSRILLSRNASRVLTLAEPPREAPTNTLQAILWDRKTGTRIGGPAVLDRSSTNLVLSPDARQVWKVWIASYGDRAPNLPNILWDFERARTILSLPSAQAASFDNSSRYLATASNTTVQVWDLKAGQARLQATCPHQCWVGSVEWSADGKHLITACYDDLYTPASAQVFDSFTGRRAGPSLNHRDGVRFATFSPDGETAITCGEDDVAILWAWRTGGQLFPPLRHKGQVLYAAFSPDGHSVATGSARGAARVWDADTGEPITQNLEHPRPIVWLQWVNGGQGLLTRTRDGELRLWNLLADSRSLERLVQDAELLSAQHIRADGTVIPHTKETLQKLWEASHSD